MRAFYVVLRNQSAQALLFQVNQEVVARRKVKTKDPVARLLIDRQAVPALVPVRGANDVESRVIRVVAKEPANMEERLKTLPEVAFVTSDYNAIPGVRVHRRTPALG